MTAVSARTTKAQRELLARVQAADPSRTYRLEPDDDGVAIMRKYTPRGEWYYVCHTDQVSERDGRILVPKVVADGNVEERIEPLPSYRSRAG